MPRGFSAVSTASADINERKKAGENTNFVRKRYLRIPDGEFAVVRFLEEGDDVVSMWAHQVPPSIQYIPCRDQDADTGEPIGEDCPGCENGLKKRFRGLINVIWRDAPQYAQKEDGRLDFNTVVGYEDTVAVWETGIEVFEDLQILDEDYGGLGSRDFKVRRKGEMLNTKYTITPAQPDGKPTKLSKADLELAESKLDLNEIVAPPSYSDWGQKKEYKKDNRVTPEIPDTSPFRKRTAVADKVSAFDNEDIPYA